MPKMSDIKVEVPDNISLDGAKLAETKGREAAIIALQQAGELTIREAAAKLELSYVEYLDFLSEKGLPISDFDQDATVSLN